MKEIGPTREQFSAEEWDRVSRLFAFMKRMKAKLKAKGGAA